ncbi:hypothetical protein ATO8_13802 [Roseivivax marinus]|jgi:hypothetical protein|uniref:GTP-binding protein Era n=1 Tax=Roseivivax marinus TaxID=1379903 RepID=W4HHI8_9RHOB|nr:DUF1491 family protein [Roseivivax marinus]ETW12174.1 hypothetical protein ATO8_13802 [Roseivivax marinus]UMA64802.1 DUF1491 family protein [Roseivivax marinus]
MAEPRLATEVWVAAYRKRLDLAGIPAFVTAKGDTTAGAVLVKVARMDGTAELFSRRFDLMTDTRKWESIAHGPEAEIDTRIARDRSTDPDLWVIEIEDRHGRHLLDEPGLA